MARMARLRTEPPALKPIEPQTFCPDKRTGRACLKSRSRRSSRS